MNASGTFVSTVSTRGDLAATGPIAAVDRLARWAIHRRLSGLQDGRLVLRDADGDRTFGTHVAAEDLPDALATVHDGRFYRALACGGSLGAAEAYLRQWWDTHDLTTLMRVLVRNGSVVNGLEGGPARILAPVARLGHLARRNTSAGSRRNIRDHYDLGNDLFELFLDDTLTYSCAIFEHAGQSLRDASIAKLDRVCRQLELDSGDHVLEIGTGWGSFAIHAAGTYGCRVTTTTISPEQHRLAAERVARAGLADRVEVRLDDYRDLKGTYDKIASIEMIEAVGHRFLDDYFRQCHRLLRGGGLMLIQAITMPDRDYASYLRSVDFIQRYVFPGSCLPSLGSMAASMGRVTDFRLVGREDITAHYATTLRHWRERFETRRAEVLALGYPERFIRLWRYYLSYCEAGFAENWIGTSQLLLRRPANAEADACG